MPPRPFRIEVPQATLDDLHRRLEATRWPAPIPGAGWDYGSDTGYIRELCAYWRSGFDWRAWEARINAYPQFLCEVDGVDIHYLHARSGARGAIPLLLIHGWPGSIVEFLALIDLLAAPGDGPAFDLVVPSLPGFGYSSAPRERGWGITRIAATFDTLMTRELGYQRYGVQGGDWGGIISSKMGSAHAANICGVHLNMVVGTRPAEMTDDDRRYDEGRNAFQAQETGYSNEQGTKPDSLTLAQSDSPAGLAAWIVEKFRTWGDCHGEIESSFTKDELLANLMLYWAPNSTASAARIYYEARRDREGFAYPKVEVPTAVAAFPGEPWMPPRHWVEPRFNIVRWTSMPRGGHFAALEEPELLAADIRAFFGSLGA